MSLKAVKEAAVGVLGSLPAPPLEKAIRALIYWQIGRLAPRARVIALLRLDNFIYRLLGQAAVAYGDGTHAKHRLTSFHDYFVERIGRDDKVLDVGCGIGAVAETVAARAGARVVGIDLNPGNVDKARRLHAHPRVEYLVGDALAELPHGPFDVVVLSNVLEHLHDRPEFLRRLMASTRAGTLLVRVPMFDRDWRVPLKREVDVEWRLDSDHKTEYTVDSFTAEITQAGLAVSELTVRWGEIWATITPARSAGA